MMHQVLNRVSAAAAAELCLLVLISNSSCRKAWIEPVPVLADVPGTGFRDNTLFYIKKGLIIHQSEL